MPHHRRPGYVPAAAHRRIIDPDPGWQQLIAERHAAAARRRQQRATVFALAMILFAIIASHA